MGNSADFTPVRMALEDAGFPVVGVVDFDLAQPIFAKHAIRYESWIARGFQGDMAYLERGKDRRLNPRLVFPELESVITVALPYDPRPVEKDGMKFARYLNGPDYHEQLKSKIHQALKAFPDLGQKICVDTSAVLERTWGAITGLGWIGKNTMLIHPQRGSYFFIAVIFTNKKFGAAPTLLKDYCGNCTRCLDSCPTQAFQAAHDLDSRKCISYLTLEKRGDWGQPISTSGYLAGCDQCQEVCPYNTKAVKYAEQHLPDLALHPALTKTFEQLESETKEEYSTRIKGSALARIKFDDFKRNLLALKQ